MQNQYAPIFIGLLLLLAGGLGGWQLANTRAQERAAQQANAIAEFTQVLEDVYPPLEEREYKLAGIVKAVGDNELTVEASVQTQRIPKPQRVLAERIRRGVRGVRIL